VGILGVLHVLSYWRPTTGSPHCRIACDGKSVISRLSSPHPIKPTKPHFDLLQAVRTLLNTCGFTIQLVFIHGHQDNGVPTVLTRDAQLNIEADMLAKCKADTTTSGPYLYCLPRNRWACYTPNGRVTKQFDLTIRTHIHSPSMKEYWKTKTNFTDEIFDSVDWPSFARAMREVPQAKRRWVTKTASGHFAHGKNMVQWHQLTSSACPRCQTPLEDKDHILQCQAPMAKEQWEKSLAALQQWMTDSGANPLLIQALIFNLHAWQTGDTMPYNTIPKLWEQQATIGWNQTLDGWLSRAWREHQEQYWHNLRS